MTAIDSQFSGYTSLAEPELLFHDSKCHRHPLLGLINHGPYGLRHRAPNAMRFALLAPHSDMPKLKSLVAELGRNAKPREAKNYYPEYPGFEAVFRTPIAPLEDNLVFGSEGMGYVSLSYMYCAGYHAYVLYRSMLRLF